MAPGPPHAGADPGTLGVGALLDLLRRTLAVVLPDELWVEGEISGLRRHPSGHVYFDLVEAPPDGASPTRVGVALFRADRAVVNRQLRHLGAVRMNDGVHVRLRARVQLHPREGRVQLVMKAIDPAYTLGLLAAARDRLLRQLAVEGLLDRNASRPFPHLPLRVGLVTARDSAAEADFVDELRSSGLGFTVCAAHVVLTGSGADRSIAAAVRAVTAASPDVVAVVRGGGARTDLAPFDSEAVARAIAACPVPVVTGIGHETDRAVADEVAAVAHKTPTACAAALVAAVREGMARADQRWVDVIAAAVAALDRSDHQLARRTSAAARSAGTVAERAGAGLDRRRATVSQRAAAALVLAERGLDLVEARVAALDPARQLARGWSITRTTDGTPLRSAVAVRPGDTLLTTVADGEVVSTVTGPAPTGGRP